MRFLAGIAANTLGILIASLAVPGFAFSGEFKTLLLAGLILSLVNAIIKPVLKLLSLPLIIITFGLFLVILNMITLKIVDIAFDSLAISTIGSLFWGTILVSIIHGAVLGLVRPDAKE